MSSLQWRNSGIALLVLLAACGGGTAVETPPEVLASITASPNDFAGSYDLVDDNCQSEMLPSFSIVPRSTNPGWMLTATSSTETIHEGDLFIDGESIDANGRWNVWFDSLRCGGTYVLTADEANRLQQTSLLAAQVGHLYVGCSEPGTADNFCGLLYSVTK